MLTIILLSLVLTVILSPLIVGAILLIPHFMMIFKRKKMIKRLASVASEVGFELHALRPLVSLSGNRAHCYDLLILSRDRAFAIKLWSSFWHDRELLVLPDGRYTERRHIPAAMYHGERHYVLRGAIHRVRVTKENFKVRPAVSVTRVLLYHPPYKAAHIIADGRAVDITVGTRLWGKTVHTPESLAELLQGRNDRSAKQNDC